MTASGELQRRLGECPLVAIIRGVTPGEVEAVGEAIYEAGIRIVEVPLNSPDPLESIGKLAKRLGDRALIGGGTVLTVEDVERVRDVGGRIIVSPSTDSAVIEATVSAGLVSSPGFFTPSEAIEAIQAGAHALKLFPAECASPALVRAQRAVFPKDLPIIVVGGVKPADMRGWLDAGATGFGLGSGLYKPGRVPAEVGDQARAYIAGLSA